MSTGAECNFIEVEPGRWTYRLQRYPYGETDVFDTYGPFSSFRTAHAHLGNNHANPGGFSVETHEQHVHEWVKTSDQEIDGFTVTIDVTSLGGEATRDEVVRHVLALPVDHPAFRIRPHYGWFRIRPHYGWFDNVTRCEACHAKPQEAVNAR